MDLSDLFPSRIVILRASEGSSIYPILNKILLAKALGMTKTKHFQKNVDLVHIFSFILKALPEMWTNMKWTYFSLPSDGAAATVERAKPLRFTNELSDSRLGKMFHVEHSKNELELVSEFLYKLSPYER